MEGIGTECGRQDERWRKYKRDEIKKEGRCSVIGVLYIVFYYSTQKFARRSWCCMMERLTTNIAQYQIRKLVRSVIIVAVAVFLDIKVLNVFQENNFNKGYKFFLYFMRKHVNTELSRFICTCYHIFLRIHYLHLKVPYIYRPFPLTPNTKRKSPSCQDNAYCCGLPLSLKLVVREAPPFCTDGLPSRQCSGYYTHGVLCFATDITLTFVSFHSYTASISTSHISTLKLHLFLFLLQRSSYIWLPILL